MLKKSKNIKDIKYDKQTQGKNGKNIQNENQLRFSFLLSNLFKQNIRAING